MLLDKNLATKNQHHCPSKMICAVLDV